MNLQDGYRQAFRLPFGEVLLIQQAGERYLVGRHCPHAGQALDTAAIHGTTIICPKHGQCYSLSDGSSIASSPGNAAASRDWNKTLRVVPLVYEGNTIGVDV